MTEETEGPGASRERSSSTGGMLASGLATEARRAQERLAALQGAPLYRAIGLLFIAALVFRYFDPISRVALIAFVGVIVAMALNAAVVRVPVRRGLATILVAIGFLLGITGAIWAGIHFLLPQLRSFAASSRTCPTSGRGWRRGRSR